MAQTIRLLIVACTLFSFGCSSGNGGKDVLTADGPPDAPGEITDTVQELVPDTGDLWVDLGKETMVGCGDGVCDEAGGETCIGCPEDCGKCTTCGNWLCELGHPKEDPQTCPEDCGPCGDDVCTFYEMQPASFCLLDCAVLCGDSQCEAGEDVPGSDDYCALDCGGCFDGVCGYQDLLNPDLAWCKDADCVGQCGDGKCEMGESFETCPVDCVVCGDGVCGKVAGEFEACPADCLRPCGDAQCEGNETPESCAVDCGPCGDGICGIKEMLEGYCPQDCPPECGNGECDPSESEITCFGDCACQPVCDPEWDCGDDVGPCGLQCGVCPQGIECTEHKCCIPACIGKVCGDDGCGGNCGDCEAPLVCDEGKCLCHPDCEELGKECGDDGCGGECGYCEDGLFCTLDECVDGFCASAVSDGYCYVKLSLNDEAATCAAESSVHPDDPCLYCDSDTESQAWSAAGDGLPCGTNMVCFSGGCCDRTVVCSQSDCGDDGCGGVCGSCPEDWSCVDGQCTQEECILDCAGKECGDDGCGGTCGQCMDDLYCTTDTCVDGKCTAPVLSFNCLLDGKCVPFNADDPENNCQACKPALDQWAWTDKLDGVVCGLGQICFKGICCNRAENCAGQECGADGCGEGVCGTCEPGFGCLNGICEAGECDPQCLGKECGDDDCGGDCGPCPGGYACEGTVCVCSPDCVDKECGDDGCGGSCGDCGPDVACEDNLCVCTPNCLGMGKDCGPDGCGGSCGNCEAGETCESGHCSVKACQPICMGKECGPDGCGDTCGTCMDGWGCLDDWCVMECDDGNIDDWDGCTKGWASGFMVNTNSAHDQTQPAVAFLPDGRYAIAWQGDEGDGDGPGVLARMFYADTSPVQEEFILNTFTDNVQHQVALLAIPGTGYEFVWMNFSLAVPGKFGIVSREFSTDGTANEPESPLSDFTATHRLPAAARLSDGGKAVVWDSNDSGNDDGIQIYGRVFNADGVPKGPSMILHPPGLPHHQRPAVAGLPTGGFMVVWEACESLNGGGPPDGDGCGIYGAIYANDFSTTKASFLVNSDPTGSQMFPTVTAAGDNYVVVWSTEIQKFVEYDLIAKRYDKDGLVVKADWVLEAAMGAGFGSPSVAGWGNGSFLVAYEDMGTKPGSESDIWIRRFDDSNQPIGTPQRANLFVIGPQVHPAATVFDTGHYLVAWESCPAEGEADDTGQDGEGCGVFSATFKPDGTPCILWQCSIGG